ncbi:hypothetical protein RYX36_004692 [Vicia faba]
MDESPFAFKTWVRGKEVDFSRRAINEFLGNPYTLGDDELDDYHIQLAKGNWDFENLRATLCKRGHTYEVNVSGHLLRFSRKILKTNAQVNPASEAVPVVAALPNQSHFDPHGDYNLAMHEAH